MTRSPCLVLALVAVAAAAALAEVPFPNGVVVSRDATPATLTNNDRLLTPHFGGLKNVAEMDELLSETRDLLDKKGGVAQLEEKFKLLDEQDEGRVPPEDAKVAIDSFDIGLSPERATILVNAFDRNRDGHTNYRELISALRRDWPKVMSPTPGGSGVNLAAVGRGTPLSSLLVNGQTMTRGTQVGNYNH